MEMNWGPYYHNCGVVINGAPSINPNEPLVFDIETTGLGPDAELVGIGITQWLDRVYYFTEMSFRVKELFATATKLVCHNAKADFKWMNKFGFPLNINQLYADTQVMSYTQDSTRSSQGLKQLAKSILNMEWPKYAELTTLEEVQTITKGKKRPKTITKTVKRKITLRELDLQTVANYNGMDLLATLKLFNYFSETMSEKQKEYYWKIEHPLCKLIYEMECQGITIDVPHLQQLDGVFEKDIIRLKDRLSQYGGAEVNFNSPKQVKEWLGRNGIQVEKTDKKALNDLGERPLISLLGRYREIQKLRDTYTKGLLSIPSLPKVYASFNQCVTKTGRLSSSEPNLQNLPTRTETGKLIRKAVIPSEGTTLVTLDYSQLELRMAAHLSQEPVLVEAFKNHKDVHQETADIMGVDRYIAKTINFAVLYGSGPHNLARTCKLPVWKAREFYKTYWAKLPTLLSWKNREIQKAPNNGGIRTLLGKWIPIPNITLPPVKPGEYTEEAKKRRAAEREVISYMVQGSAHELVKLAMVEFYKYNIIPLIQVHDELVFEEVHPELFELFAKELMENVYPLSVPLEVGVGIGKHWGECK